MLSENVIRSRRHLGPIYDAQTDDTEKFLLTSGADGIILAENICQIEKPNPHNILLAHDAQIWAMEWAHSSFGQIFASASYDAKIIIWEKSNGSATGNFRKVYENDLHSASVNSISWAPKEFGRRLVSASSDGTLRETFYADGRWMCSEAFGFHENGALCVEWLNAILPVNTQPTGILCSGGNDATLRFWAYQPIDKAWKSFFKIHFPAPVSEISVERLSDLTGELLVDVSVAHQVRIIRINLSDLIEKLESGDDAGVSFQESVIHVESPPVKLSWSPVESILSVVSADGKIQSSIFAGGSLRPLNH